MKKMKRRVLSRRTQQSVLAVLAIALTFSTILPAFASSDHSRGNAAVSIDNFGQVNDHIYRGSQPNGNGYRQLASIGVKTILDLREDAEHSAKSDAEHAGLRYINLPLVDKRYPQTDAADKFLEVVNDQANWPVYVHCAGGRHRTGAMIAVYRMSVDHWTVDQAYNEMKQYDFYTSRGHECFKDYVFDFYRTAQSRPASIATQTASVGASTQR
jgi:protein tyrosine/serine phosphatase